MISLTLNRFTLPLLKVIEAALDVSRTMVQVIGHKVNNSTRKCNINPALCSAYLHLKVDLMRKSHHKKDFREENIKKFVMERR